MNKYLLLFSLLILFPTVLAGQDAHDRRDLWLGYMDEMVRPVMENLANERLKEVMPVELPENSDNPEHRTEVAYLEAFARTLSGIAPWLNSDGGSEWEQELREEYRQWAIRATEHAVNPTGNDYMVWEGGQPLVDASFFALGLIRSPWLWEALNEETQQQVREALLSTRTTVPVYSNWILFSGMIEAFFAKYDLPYDPVRIEYGMRTFMENWYAGDGMFNDGEHFAMDYYNSYVIQPYLTNIMEAISQEERNYEWYSEDLEEITQRYAEIQERSIAADGSFPVQGRSIVYRTGAYHHLADMALRVQLPESLEPAQVREALTAVLRRTLENPQNYTEQGWLTIGLNGHQPELADFYNNTGSLYIASTIFLPLGLNADHPFWTDADRPWTSVKIWGTQE
ncbi:MAG: DUF2264 domain-containing protein [Balneolaceae bacterium]